MYKYTTKFVSDLLFKKNCIRIGTLNGYRDMEAKQGISDPLEGSYHETLIIDRFNEQEYYKDPILRENVQHGFHIEQGAINCQIIDCVVESEIKSPNYLIFCTAHKKSKEVMSEFEDATICYQIHKIQSFYQLITWKLEKLFESNLKFHGVVPVHYDEYNRLNSDIRSRRLSPVIAKTSEFSPQCELRAIWEVPEELIKEPHYDLQILGLSKTCRIIDI